MTKTIQISFVDKKVADDVLKTLFATMVDLRSKHGESVGFSVKEIEIKPIYQSSDLID